VRPVDQGAGPTETGGQAATEVRLSATAVAGRDRGSFSAAGGNPACDPSRLLRDYVVRVREDSDDPLLGRAYVALGRARLVAGFFILERHRPLTSDARSSGASTGT
jgi:hypothetical protein